MATHKNQVSELQFGLSPGAKPGTYLTKGISQRTMEGVTYLMATSKHGKITEFFGKLLGGPVRLKHEDYPPKPGKFANFGKRARVLVVKFNHEQIDAYIYKKLWPFAERAIVEKIAETYPRSNLS